MAEPKASSAIFDLNPGPLSLLGNDFAENLLSEMKLNKTKLPSGATVAHLAYYLAEHLGCDPIIFVGQDLGFSDGLCYTPGTSYEDVWRPELGRFCTVEMKQWEQIVRDRHILRKSPTTRAGRCTPRSGCSPTSSTSSGTSPGRARTIIDATEGGVLKARRNADARCRRRDRRALHPSLLETICPTRTRPDGLEQAQPAPSACERRRDEAAQDGGDRDRARSRCWRRSATTPGTSRVNRAISSSINSCPHHDLGDATS